MTFVNEKGRKHIVANVNIHFETVRGEYFTKRSLYKVRYMATLSCDTRQQISPMIEPAPEEADVRSEERRVGKEC